MILYCIGIVLFILLVLYIRFVFHKKIDDIDYPASIHGLYMNHDKKEGSRIFMNPNGKSFSRHRQGTSSYLDEEWDPSSDSVFMITSSLQHVTATKRHAIFENNMISIYEDKKLVELLEKYTEECNLGETEPPTFDNIKELYDLVEVTSDQADELAKVLFSKKACAISNDVHIHVGAYSNLYMARGMFVMDKKHTVFYYVPRETIPIIVDQEIDTKVVDIELFKSAGFAGAMN